MLPLDAVRKLTKRNVLTRVHGILDESNSQLCLLRNFVQPVDQGIGNALKIRYRKYLHKYIGTQVMLGEPPLEGIDILRACLWVARGWNSLNNANTVIRCFQKSDFRHHTSPEVEDIDEDIPAYEQHILLMEEQVADPPAMRSWRHIAKG